MSDGERVIRVVLVDEHEVVRMGTKTLLGAQPDMRVVAETADAGEATEMICGLLPDVAVMAVKFLDGDKGNEAGIQICREVNDRCPQVAALMFSAYHTDRLLRLAFDAGAAGYILKTARPAELVEAVRLVAGGRVLIERTTARRLRATVPAAVSDPLAVITIQERRILELISIGMSNQEIAARMHLGRTTVRNYVSVLYRKLGVTSRGEAVAWTHRAAQRLHAEPLAAPAGLEPATVRLTAGCSAS